MTNWKKNRLAIQLAIVCSIFFMANAHAVSDAVTKVQSLSELSQAAPAVRHLNIEAWRTRAGSRVLFVKAPELPMFDVQLTFAAGSSRDGEKHGVAMLTNAMLNEGVKDKDVTDIAKIFEGVGAEFGNGSYRDMAIISLRSLTDAKKSRVALDLLIEVVSQPTFPEGSFKRLKNQLLTGFEIEKKTPSKIIGRTFYDKLYGSHPYAHNSAGDADSINKMTIKDLEQFYKKTYTAKNLVIAIVGDLSKKQAEEIANKISDALPEGKDLPVMANPAPAKASQYHTEFASQQMHINMGELGVTRNDPDYVALSVGNQILGGGGLTSRLMTEVRERRGLTYGIYSGFSTMQVAGPFSIGLQTRAEMTEGTIELIKNVVKDYLAKGPTEQELADTKREIAGSFPLTNASNSSIVGQLGAIGFYNLPLNYLEDYMNKVQGLTVEQIQTAMNKHLKVDDFIVVTVGPTVKQQALPTPTNASTKTIGAPN